MVSSFTSAPRSGFTILRKAGSSSCTLDSAFRYFTAAGQYFVDGGRILVALYATRCLDPDAHELCSGLVTMAELSVVAVISVLLVFGYFFSTIANWIAAPFNGLLAEQLEARLTGATPPDTGIFGIMKDVPRIMKREWQNLLVSAARNCIANSLLHPRHWAKPSRRYCGSCLAHGC